ncbi:MAG: hypothetical protein KG003_04025 [Bacteroidetes bacterium]|nr:hypothetical protein [Bacteroidota bacterium]
MSSISKLASALHRRDEEPNIQLAELLVAKNDISGISELVSHLNDKGTDIPNDCIKVLYEVGARKPELIAPFLDIFLSLLHHKNNRLQWGAMTALAAIAKYIPDKIYKSLNTILDAAEKGSVITRDNAVKLLITLCENKEFNNDCFALLLEIMAKSPLNQVPMYAENTQHLVNTSNRNEFIRILQSRLTEVEKESMKKRMEKVIRKISI